MEIYAVVLNLKLPEEFAPSRLSRSDERGYHAQNASPSHPSGPSIWGRPPIDAMGSAPELDAELY